MLHHAGNGSHVLKDASRLPIDLNGHTGFDVAELVKRDDPRMIDVAIRRSPGNALIRMLLRDLGVEFALPAANSHLPLVMRLVALFHRFDMVEKLGERFKLRPLVVCGAHRDAHVDGVDYLSHGILLLIGVPFRRYVGRGFTEGGCIS